MRFRRVYVFFFSTLTGEHRNPGEFSDGADPGRGQSTWFFLRYDSL